MESTHAAKRQRIGERTLLACTGCKQRKLKCDGQSPKCQNCIKSSRECLVEDPATGLQRPRDYMQTLESHVAHLESLLQSLRPDIAGDHLNAQFVPPGADSAATWLFSGHHPLAAPALSQAANLIDAPEAYTSPAGQSGADSFVDDLSSDVALLCISAAGREPHYFGPSSAVSFSRIASQAMGIRTSQGRAVSESPSEQRAGRDRSGRTTKAVMPTDAQADTYVSAYFNNIHPQYPFLHEPTFQRWQGECRQTGDLDDELSRAGNIPTFFVFMVYAIGCLTLGPSQYGAAEDFYAVALDRITPILDLDSLESIQSILCCAVYSIRSPVGASLWKVSGMAIRHCVELGYHRSAKRFRQQTDMLAREMSTRCFWVAYDIDRVAANILGRPDGISDHLIDAEVQTREIRGSHAFTDHFRSIRWTLTMSSSPLKRSCKNQESPPPCHRQVCLVQFMSSSFDVSGLSLAFTSTNPTAISHRARRKARRSIVFGKNSMIGLHVRQMPIILRLRTHGLRSPRTSGSVLRTVTRFCFYTVPSLWRRICPQHSPSIKSTNLS